VAGQVPHSTMHERYIPVEAVAKSSNTIIADIRLIPNESIAGRYTRALLLKSGGSRVAGECQAGEKARYTTAPSVRREDTTRAALVTHLQSVVFTRIHFRC
jgi:hypothetical protein